jgi:hypothetical protein
MSNTIVERSTPIRMQRMVTVLIDAGFFTRRRIKATPPFVSAEAAYTPPNRRLVNSMVE